MRRKDFGSRYTRERALALGQSVSRPGAARPPLYVHPDPRRTDPTKPTPTDSLKLVLDALVVDHYAAAAPVVGDGEVVEGVRRRHGHRRRPGATGGAGGGRATRDEGVGRLFCFQMGWGWADRGWARAARKQIRSIHGGMYARAAALTE